MALKNILQNMTRETEYIQNFITSLLSFYGIQLSETAKRGFHIFNLV